MKRVSLLTIIFCLRAFAAGNVVGLWHFDEGSGIVAHDSSGYGNNGQLGSTPHDPSWVAGKFGSALHFDGDDWVQVPSSTSLSPNGSITLEAWVKIDSYGQPGVYIIPVISKWNDVGVDLRTYVLTIYYGRVRFDVSHTGKWGGSSCAVNSADRFACTDSASVYSANYVALNRWTHVAGVFDSSTKQLQVFVDGIPDTSVTAESSNVYQNSDSLLIGAADFASTRQFMPGAIDEARVWNRALSPAEVLSSAQAGLRGLWHFNSLNPTPTVPSSPDDSGLGNDAYMLSGATLTTSAKFGAGALSVNGQNDTAVVGETPSIDITGPITVEAWVNLNAFPNFMNNGLQVGFAPIVAKWEDISGNYRSYVLAVMHDGSVRFDISHTGKFSCGSFNNAGPYQCANSDSALVISSNKIALHTWSHIAGVYDGQTLQVFVNGVADTSIAATGGIDIPSPYNPPIAFGFANEGGIKGQYTDGFIDEVHLWARGLGANEIAFDANNATAAELYLPGMIDQDGLTNNGGGNGTGATFESELDAGMNKTVEFLEFLVPDSAGAHITDVDGHASNGNGASLVGWVTGNNALDALITGKTVNPPILNFQINLSDKTKLNTQFDWSH